MDAFKGRVENGAWRQALLPRRVFLIPGVAGVSGVDAWASHWVSASSKSRTPKPVAPFARYARSSVVHAVPAMSRCAHGILPTYFSRNAAAVIAPPSRPAEFLMSATSLLILS